MTLAKDIVHGAFKTASAEGACNLPHCAFDGGECCIPCAHLQAAVDAARQEGYDDGYAKGREAGYDAGHADGFDDS